MSKRKHIFIPCINSLNLLPNLADLDLNSKSTDPITTETREQYAMIILLLFYPFRTQDDLMLNGSYWVKYEHVLSQNNITQENLKVIQNIQDCCYNCSNLRRAKDDLEKTTSYTPHKDDSKIFKDDNEDTIDLDEMAEMLQQLDDVGVRDVNPEKRNLSIIAKRCNIIEQNISPCTQDIPDITAIPQHITDSINIPRNDNTSCIQNDRHNGIHNADVAMNCDMVIDILNDVVLEGLPLDTTDYDPLYNDVLASSS